ncbi:hypothetical protein [Nocardioides sp. GXQ0305]|uniref:hypothetical protein n=1 Tax=Nocardioides sp. GXQ0305 TaxID=3423912 RepID=UPI003D7D4462
MSETEAESVSLVDVGVALVTTTVAGPVVLTITLTRGIVTRVQVLSAPWLDVLVLHPPLLPARLQPGRALARLSHRGYGDRTALVSWFGRTLDAVVPRAADEVVRRVDVEALVARLDLAGLAQQVITEVDLPEIIRESTSAVSSEAVREVRMRGISGDDTLGRAVDRLLLRHRRASAEVVPVMSPEQSGARGGQRATVAPS